LAFGSYRSKISAKFCRAVQHISHRLDESSEIGFGRATCQAKLEPYFALSHGISK